MVKLTTQEINLATTPVAEVMSQNPIVIKPSEFTDPFQAIELFCRHHIRHLPVLDDQGQLLGVVTPHSLRQSLKSSDLLRFRRVAEVMSSQVITAQPTATVMTLARLMVTHQVSCVVITEFDEDPTASGQLPVGIVTERDLVKLRNQNLDLETTIAQTVMSGPLMCIASEDSLWNAHQKMQELNVRRLVVTCQGVLAGLVTQTSILSKLNPADIYSTIEVLQQEVTRLQNERMEWLQGQKSRLERRVEQRTALLSQTNQQLVTEVAKRQGVEDKLRQSLKTLSDFKYALDQSAIVAITDAQGTLTYVNDQFCQIFQYEREELIGQTHRMINSGYHAPEFFQDLWSTIARGQIWRGEIKNRAKDGSYYWVDTTIVPFLDESGKPWQYLAIRTDITERKQRDREVREFASQLQRSNRELKNFAYIVSHDLQEPLRKMKSFCQLLARECQDQFTVNEKAHRYLHYIIDAAERQRTMIQALLKYSQLGSNDSTKVAINLGAVVSQVLEDLSISIAETQATVTVSDLPTVGASPTQMAQLFLNLIGNGIKFKGEAPPRIQITAQLYSSEWLISVQDNGIGINPKYAERIFQIFQRLHSRSEYSGTGIGLAICRKIVEAHGGRIWVTSEPGQGSTFYFTLPVSPVPVNNSDLQCAISF